MFHCLIKTERKMLHFHNTQKSIYCLVRSNCTVLILTLFLYYLFTRHLLYILSKFVFMTCHVWNEGHFDMLILNRNSLAYSSLFNSGCCWSAGCSCTGFTLQVTPSTTTVSRYMIKWLRLLPAVCMRESPWVLCDLWPQYVPSVKSSRRSIDSLVYKQ